MSRKMTEAPAKAPLRYTGETILGMERFRDDVDLLTALLRPGDTYTVQQVLEKMERYRKGTVK